MRMSIELSAEFEQRLDALVMHSGMTKAALLHEFVEQGLTDLETEYRAVAVLERVRTGQEPIYSAAAVRKALELNH